MKVSDLHWTWYMYASIPARVVNRTTTKPKAKNSRKVEIFSYFSSMKIDEKNISLIKQLCKEYKVRTFSAFGSVTREDFRNDSDIDFVVDFDENDPFKYTDLYFQLKEKLENLFKRQIDLIEERAIKNNFFRKELDRTKVLIYGR